jgi:PAS domain S-box-containing protein
MTSLEQRVLAVMPGVRDADRTVELLAKEGVACVAFVDLPSACRELVAGGGTLLVAEEMLLRDRTGCLATTLAAQPTWSMVPVIVLGRGESDERIGELVRDAKAQVTLVERPVRTRTLVSVVKAALRARANQYEIRDAMIERERQASLLRDREERLEFALKAGRLGAWELELGTSVFTCSELCKAAFGRGAAEAFSYEDLKRSIHPGDRDRVLAAIRETVENGADYDVEYRNVWPNGEVHWVLVRGRPLRGSDGKATRLVGVSLDVTDKQRAEGELKSQAEQLRDSARRKDEFLATLAHELRNPLAPVRTGLSVLDHAPSVEAAARTRDMMERQLAHMVRLIDDLLDVSRITSGKVVLRRELLPLRSVIDVAIEANRPFLESARHELSVSLPGAELLVEADATRLAQVVGNLLNNAIKYTPAGGCIKVAARRENGEAVIEVTDDGLGIPSEHLEGVFQMFNQVNRTLDRAQGGLGIGLALVRELVTLHGGTVKAGSAGPGRGSTFTVRLPLAEAKATVNPTPVRAETAQQRRVLVVDDNVDAAQMLAMLLEMYGHRTCTAHTGVEALDAAATFKPEVVFLDIGLPGMNGYEVARRLRSDPDVCDATLVALTGWGTDEDKSLAMQAGFDFHLTKPVETTAIDRVLSAR